MRGLRWILVLGGAWLCVGCAEPRARLPDLEADAVADERRRQQVIQMRDYYAQRARVDSVGYRIREANRDACGERVAPAIGLSVATAQSLPRKYRDFAYEALGVDWSTPTVIAVAAGSPAATARIERGDQVLTFNNEPVPATGITGWVADRLKRNGTRPVTMVLRREGAERQAAVQPTISCAIPIRFVVEPRPNAYTDDKKIVIQSGILRTLRSDADLAVIIGHELAHVTMGHHDKKLRNRLLGQIGGAVIDGGLVLGGIYTGGAFSREFGRVGARAFSIEFEREADYVGAYYAARAGYDISGAAHVWQALSLESPDSIRLERTHPTTPARFVQMQKAIAEIADKRSRNLPLEPEMKPRATAVTVSADWTY